MSWMRNEEEEGSSGVGGDEMEILMLKRKVWKSIFVKIVTSLFLPELETSLFHLSPEISGPLFPSGFGEASLDEWSTHPGDGGDISLKRELMDDGSRGESTYEGRDV